MRKQEYASLQYASKNYLPDLCLVRQNTEVLIQSEEAPKKIPSTRAICAEGRRERPEKYPPPLYTRIKFQTGPNSGRLPS